MSKRAIQATVLTGKAALGVAPGATITIKDAVTGANRTLWSDYEGTSGTGNPVTADANGQFLVYANPGRVQITVTDGATTRIWENVELGHDDARNVLINSDFQVPQRGTSFPAIASDAYSLDRWRYNNTTSAIHTISQETDVPAQALADDTGGFSIKIDVTTADEVIGGTNLRALIEQRIEGYNIKHLLNRKCTLSFWVKATKTGIYCIALKNSGSNRTYVAEYTIASADTWEYQEINFTMHNGASGTWDFTNGIGLFVRFCLAAGSDFYTTAGAWQTGDFESTSNQVNACDNLANNFQLALVQLRAGNSATPFQHQAYGAEFDLCRRYFERINSETAFSVYGAGECQSSTTAKCVVLVYPKRTVCVGSVSAAADFRLNAQTGATVGVTSITMNFESSRSIRVDATASGGGLVDGDGTFLLDDGSNNSYIDASAEL